ncbi:MAG: type II secretion system protein N, partial [Pseudomonadota bacterium]
QAILTAATAFVTLGAVALVALPALWHSLGHNGQRIDPIPRVANLQQAVPLEATDILAPAPFGAVARAEVEPAAVAPSALDLTLIGILQASDPSRSSALITGPEGTLRYRRGDTVQEGAALIDIASDHVVLRVGGTLRPLYFPDAVASEPAPARDISRLRAATVVAKRLPREATLENTQSYIDLWRRRIAANPEDVLTAIGLIPTEAGYVIADKHDSGVRLAGLRPGDLVSRVNGQQVGDVEADKRFYDEIAASGQARLEVVRGGQTLTMTFPLR